MRCPWPAIRLARLLRDGNGPVEIDADDPAAARELEQVAKAAGATIEQLGSHRFRILPQERAST
ncbi:sulfurtransferase TusA family protein [Stakelama sp. CBK3Z-3]|uniref:Sulfurtransferase TusA family protein n=2 Tax=Stakelama flava TaxID=2860338 RepID=A0ABS6XMH5_9SPHN|nr:sulfurtransferase TusA family protein [Stakelama flava]